MKKWLKAVILSYLSFLFFGSFTAIGMLWTGALEDSLPFLAEIKMFLYYFFAGAIGGSLRHLYLFCSHYMEGELNDYRKWIMYIFYPIFATGTAVVAVTLIQSGLLLVEFTDYKGTPYAPISIAFFVGFGFNRFVNLLNSLSKNLFHTDKKNNDKSAKSEDNNFTDQTIIGPGSIEPIHHGPGSNGPINNDLVSNGPGSIEPINNGPGSNGPVNNDLVSNGPGSIESINNNPGSIEPMNHNSLNIEPQDTGLGRIDPEPTNIGPEHMKPTRNSSESDS